MRFVAPNAHDFLERYDAIKSGICSKLPYDKTLSRFLEAVQEYEKHFNRFYKEAHKPGQPPATE
jgi:hypothetical protein